EGEQLGQGRENAKQFLRETPELMVTIDERVRTSLASAQASAAAPVVEAAVDPDDVPISLG
ncbi:MAG: DNA recombination/repair protein RecA, partial [Thaumarchaeota archaeon]|nr:DNA recombination/repair protein RecA [Nitrososphaerota archaeon]